MRAGGRLGNMAAMRIQYLLESLENHTGLDGDGGRLKPKQLVHMRRKDQLQTFAHGRAALVAAFAAGDDGDMLAGLGFFGGEDDRLADVGRILWIDHGGRRSLEYTLVE